MSQSLVALPSWLIFSFVLHFFFIFYFYNMNFWRTLVDLPRNFWFAILHYFGIVYTWGTLLLLFSVNVYFTCPALEGDRCPYYIAFGVFLIFEIIINFFCFHYYARLNRVDVIFPPSALPPANVRPDGMIEFVGDPSITKFCFNCRRTVPIRSHHCPLCNYCVLKKDHHCFLTGGCVGFGNQRYFVVFLFWAAFGALFGAWVTGRYMNAYFKPFLPFGFIDYIFPIAFKRWMLFQHCTIVDLGFALVFSAGVAGGCTSLIFFVLQCQLILKGKTMYEMYRKDATPVKPDRMPVRLRLECVFGRYWYGNFLFPLPFPNRMDEAFKKMLYECHLKEM